MELYCNSKTQHTTIKYSQQLSEHNVRVYLSLSPTPDCLHDMSLAILTLDSNQLTVMNNLVTMEPNYSLFTLLSDSGN
jgi:radical SAM superfamily enzyme